MDFASKFTEFDARKLHKLYKHTIKKRQESQVSKCIIFLYVIKTDILPYTRIQLINVKGIREIENLY